MYPKTFFERNRPQPESGHVFVMMSFADRFRVVYDTIRVILEGPELNFTCTRADELFGGGHIIEDILRWIGKAEVIIADVTTKNPNVFYELGIAHMAKDIEKVLILTQDMNDVPFDLRPFRCIMYEQSGTGLPQLQMTVASAVKEISGASYRFAVRQNGHYRFPHKLFGPDRCFHDFEIAGIWVGSNAAKFHLREYRHVLGQPEQKRKEQGHGIICGEAVPLDEAPWKIVLEETSGDTAQFRVVPNK